MPTTSTSATRGFTLIEMILSMTIVMVIFTATYSVMRLAGRVVPNPGNPQTCLLEASRALDQVAGDLGYATSVTEFQPASITFTVADRTGDSVGETLRYWWNGTAGTSLMFSVNGGPGTAIADDVREFSLTAQQGSRMSPSVYVWGPRTLLTEYKFLLNLGAGQVTANNAFAFYFLPALPSDVSRWKITEVRMPVRTDGASDGQSAVQVRTASGGLPTTTVLDQATLNESLLGGAFSWQPYTFSSPPPLAPSTAVCIVMQGTAGASACDLQFQNLLYLGSTPAIKSTDFGGSWSVFSGQSLLYEVYGHVETVTPGVAQPFLDQVKCTLRLGPTASARVEMAARVLNQPVLP